MLKNILNIHGAQQMSRSEQKTINGGDLILSCQGPGTGGIYSIGYAAVCAAYPAGTRCVITDESGVVHGDGCIAECAGGPTFWML